MRALVIDIEAVRDWAVWQPPDDNLEAFAPPYAWRPICIGCVLLEDGGAVAWRGFETKRIGIIEPADEGDLLRAFADTMAKLGNPAVVTWSGRAFDLPVLMLRGLRHGLSSPWYYQSRDHRYRFTEAGHCDLADAMGDYGSVRSMGLDGMAKLIGLPGKFGDIDGAGVGDAYAAGRHAEIAAYCMADAVQTAFLFLRWQLLKGEITPDSYRASAADLLSKCAADARLGSLADRVERGVLLLETAARAA